ncbi:glycosyltransferase family 2 protein [Sulfitobacter dubius]|uniref:glycosyltransferase family 2 protein n=1 Tax=Sulfitobacter dubius TaxID=218673 RepID=UPI0008E18907|nr:glycosyltransferase [Sulfitobacter dubius]SFG91455.1 Glycosyltransferase like family 2 [Sulfitobacter dubius]
MTTTPVNGALGNGVRVSIVIVSRNRPEALRRCLTGVGQLQYAPFEVIVVADPAGIAAVRDLPFTDALKLVNFDTANISVARNLGIAQAAGEVVAFIDDDAMPEPLWLRHLMAPAAQPDVAAMTGFVRGRNGISFQYRARQLNALGEPEHLDVDAETPSVMLPSPSRAIKTEGTNMAFRRDVLADLGGFDPAFHYFLDETDLNMRLARAGHATAIVPLAEVHHGFAANQMRSANRVPRDLYDIGASWAVFHRKHLPEQDRAAQWAHLRASERRRLLRYLVSGGLEPRDVTRLLHRLDKGHAEGMERVIGNSAVPRDAHSAFRPFPACLRRSVAMFTRPIKLAKDRAKAAKRAESGEIVTLFSLSPTALYHHVAFDPINAIWLQTGGIYGKSSRDEAVFRLTRRQDRLKKEVRRVARQRGFSDDTCR